MSPTNYLRYKYTPDEIDESDFLARFVVRTEEFTDLFEKISEADYQKSQQHYIVVGQRGQGKTSLLRRLKIAVENDAVLSEFLLPVKFTEEQYQIRSLCRLWEEVADYLQSIYPNEFTDIHDKMEAHFDDDNYDLLCFSYLENYVKSKNKKLLLLIDNIDELLGKLKEKEQRQMREILISSSTFRIIGGSTTMIEQHYDYGKPFYEFFQIIRLKGLNKEECVRFLKVIGDDDQRKIIERIINDSPQRIETLRRLTGGVPRTMLMLFDIFVDEVGNAFEDLLKVLDEATPLYKHRMDDLPATLQDITHVIAMNWDGLGTREIAAKTRMASKEVSAQLKQLENKYGIIESTSIGKNKIYKLEERFFNIWYLMRFGRKKDRQKVEWLVRFLNSWCSPQELEQRAHKFLSAVKEGKVKSNYAYHMCEALGFAGLPAKTEYLVKEKVRDFLQKDDSDLAKIVSSSENEVIGKAIVMSDLKAVESGDTDALVNLGNMYGEQKDYAQAEQYYLKAVESGNTDALLNLGYMYDEQKDYAQAEQYYLKAVESGNTDALLILGYMYDEQKDYAQAKQYYLKAVESGNTDALFNLGYMYREQKDYAQAEPYFLKAMKCGDTDATNMLSWLYFEKAEKLKEAIELANSSFNANEELENTHTYAVILLWAEDFELSYQIFGNWLKYESAIEEEDYLTIYLILLISKGQYHKAKSFLEMEEYQLKDRLKPVWYALMSLMQNEFPHEIVKMGGELQETVQEMLQRIKEMEEKYKI